MVSRTVDAKMTILSCMEKYGNRPELVPITIKLLKLARCACKNTLADLGLDYLDLYLIHWPFAFRDNGELFPMKDGKADVVDVDVTETWKGMEECVKLGFAKSIGISNFNSEQIKKVVNSATIKPVTNQVECHPYLNQKKLREFCKQHNIVITAYSPLGNPGSKFNAPGTPNILQDTKLNELAKKHGKSVAQIILRYLIDVGTVPIPKSVTKTRIEENINVFDFKLSPEELAYVDSIDRNLRTCAFDTCDEKEADETFSPVLETVDVSPL
ncbi:unnamed protein product [Timema podura]|uniref:NADP-dependent oxidoreductase domain-containing protein n=1 Tax=Timema podura TaxID=61482 RepID=A0ABN7NKS7_TIMPD|nr:unnamed protein product [Timema podura]